MARRKRKRNTKSSIPGAALEGELTAAEKMAAFRREMNLQRVGLCGFVGALPFSLDAFQVQALEHVARGENVLVCAPTASGKTVVGEGAAFMALHSGRRAFYTTPLKALSNQKFRDFQKTYGDERVGLLTGDTSINPEAEIVVMTTEVLRNMIYAGSSITGLDAVVLDEVHCLADRVRGPVWEEILIGLPDFVTVVALSATISNAGEFGRWIREIRSSCEIVTSEIRPVPLYQHMLVGNSLCDLYSDGSSSATGALGYINPDLEKAIERTKSYRNSFVADRRRHLEKTRRPPTKFSRVRVLRELEKQNLLPAIEFVFSRAGCDEAVAEIVKSDLTLTTPAEQEEIFAETERILLAIPFADHNALHLEQWRLGLERGVAAHHAGMLPILKESIERLFAAGLLKIVYATETLALGVNMPARTVVVESLEKWNGTALVRLQPGEFTQLTGRAGRRGIDVEGHAVTLHRGVVNPEELAQLAASPPRPLTSAFRPNYNMAVNLLAHAPLDLAISTLESSFAQFQADESVVGLSAQLRKARQEAEAAAKDVSCSQGAASEYFEIRAELATLEKKLRKERLHSQQQQYLRSLTKLQRGQIISFKLGKRQQSAVVVSAAPKGRAVAETSIWVVLATGKGMHLDAHDSVTNLQVIGFTQVPKKGMRRKSERQQLAAEIRAVGNFPKALEKSKRKQSVEEARLRQQISSLEQKMRAHPVHRCPRREEHALYSTRWMKKMREANNLAQRIEQRTSSIAHEFRLVCQILTDLGYLAESQPTKRGVALRKIFGERDLLIAECIVENAWGELNAPEFAAILSSVVYEPRNEVLADPQDILPTANLRSAWLHTKEIFGRIHAREMQAGLERVPEPCGDLMVAVYKWAKGATLSDILLGVGISGGDFVRWIRQVVDLLEQLRRLGNEILAAKASAAQELIQRGVVEWIEA